jgi:hypothetical protein
MAAIMPPLFPNRWSMPVDMLHHDFWEWFWHWLLHEIPKIGIEIYNSQVAMWNATVDAVIPMMKILTVEEWG